jgi:HTH-type transcriptional regulator/antitoxin HigA
MPKTRSMLTEQLPARFESLVRLYAPRAIHDQSTYEATQELVDALTNLPRRSKGQAEYLDTLSTLMQSYENEVDAIDLEATPVEVLRHLLEEHKMTASDLGRLLGERSLGPKVLNGERELSKAHIRVLAKHFELPADVFL